MRGDRDSSTFIGPVVYIVLFLFLGGEVGWLRLKTHLPFWMILLIVSPQIGLAVFALVLRSEADNPDMRPRKFGKTAAFVSALFTLRLAYSAASYLILVYLYGLSRVQREHLHFVDMPKRSAWIVSNGDKIAEAYFLNSPMAMAIWFALMAMVVPVLLWVLPKEDDDRAGWRISR